MILKKVLNLIIKIAMAFVMLLALIYLHFYELNPIYKPKSQN